MSAPAPPGTVITFYSYKGGVGRTLALANVAALLAKWGRRVLCIDWDLEAPGLHQYFKEQLPAHVLESEPGLVELVETWSRGEAADWRDHVRRIELTGAHETLSVLPAGRLDDTYVARMQRLDWEALYARQQLGTTLERWRDEWKQAYDFILVDSRTGVTDIGGICTIQLPDQLVLCVTANEQSLQGAKDVAVRAARQRQRLPFDRGGVPCVPVPTRFEGRVESALAKQWLERFAGDLEALYREWIAATITPRALLDLLKIPYVPLWSFGEGLPVLGEGTTDPESIGFAFETLAALLAGGLRDSEQLLLGRADVVAAARRAGHRTASQQHTVFISYSSREREFATAIAQTIERADIPVWIDRELTAGSEWSTELKTAIDRASTVLFVIGPRFRSSRWTELEWRHALQRLGDNAGLRRIIPVLLPGTSLDALPDLLRSFVPLQLTADRWQEQLLEALRPK